MDPYLALPTGSDGAQVIDGLSGSGSTDQGPIPMMDFDLLSKAAKSIGSGKFSEEYILPLFPKKNQAQQPAPKPEPQPEAQPAQAPTQPTTPQEPPVAVAVPVQRPDQAKAKGPKFKTYADIINFEPKTGDEYEEKRMLLNRMRSKFYNEANQYTSGMDVDNASKYFKFLDEKLKRDGVVELKPFNQTEAYKSAENLVARQQYQQNAQSLTILGGAIQEAEQMIRDKKSKSEITNFLSANIPKILQSLGTGQSDAIQDAEWKRIGAELTTLFGVNIKDWVSFVSKRESILGVLGTDPQAFIDKSKRIYNIASKQYNNYYDTIENQLGKKTAEQLKVGGLQRFENIEKPAENFAQQQRAAFLRFQQQSQQIERPSVNPQLGRPVRIAPAPAQAPQASPVDISIRTD